MIQTCTFIKVLRKERKFGLCFACQAAQRTSARMQMTRKVFVIIIKTSTGKIEQNNFWHYANYLIHFTRRHCFGRGYRTEHRRKKYNEQTCADEKHMFKNETGIGVRVSVCWILIYRRHERDLIVRARRAGVTLHDEWRNAIRRSPYAGNTLKRVRRYA